MTNLFVECRVECRSESTAEVTEARHLTVTNFALGSFTVLSIFFACSKIKTLGSLAVLSIFRVKISLADTTLRSLAVLLVYCRRTKSLITEGKTRSRTCFWHSIAHCKEESESKEDLHTFVDVSDDLRRMNVLCGKSGLYGHQGWVSNSGVSGQNLVESPVYQSHSHMSSTFYPIGFLWTFLNSRSLRSFLVCDMVHKPLFLCLLVMLVMLGKVYSNSKNKTN